MEPKNHPIEIRKIIFHPPPLWGSMLIFSGLNQITATGGCQLSGANILFPWFWYLHQYTPEVWQLAKLTSYLSTQIRKGERLPTSSFFRGVSELKLWGPEYPDSPGGSCSPNRFCSLDQTTLDCCRRGPTSAVGIRHMEDIPGSFGTCFTERSTSCWLDALVKSSLANLGWDKFRIVW